MVRPLPKVIANFQAFERRCDNVTTKGLWLRAISDVAIYNHHMPLCGRVCRVDVDVMDVVR
jgi:hypothetical protein